MANRRWTEDETKLALYLYFQLPFGKLHSGNPEICDLARMIDRTPSSVAMKLGNFASLDPKITGTGRKGLSGASALDRAVFQHFQHDWTRLVAEGENLWASSTGGGLTPSVKEVQMPFIHQPYQGTSIAERVVNQRVGQGFFRRAVLANFDECCCITGIADPRLLNASHIRPWRLDTANRHNPANGYSFSATFDRAYDSGLITVEVCGKVRVSGALLQSDNAETRAYFSPYEGRQIRAPRRFEPDPVLVRWHNSECFVG
jgi:predicted restriction endonuclease